MHCRIGQYVHAAGWALCALGSRSQREELLIPLRCLA